MAYKKPAKKGAAAVRTKKANGPKTAEPVHKRPTYRREIAAAVCLLLGIFTFIGYFSLNGLFIEVFCNLLKGLVGWGFYAVPPLLVACAFILTFHRGRPVRFRVFCTLMLSVAVGAIVHLYFSKTAYKLSLPMIKELWNSGVASASGGAVAGTLTEVFTYLFSRVGTYIFLIFAIIFLLLVSLNQTITGIVDAYRRRPRYEPEETPADEAETYQYQPPPAKRSAKKMIDI
ncbi:MAG: DNA translocase FtsK, partial [Clostridiales bacterium]|nr:DNA translocase FtsK [Clostridiales bacterium]